MTIAGNVENPNCDSNRYLDAKLTTLFAIKYTQVKNV